MQAEDETNAHRLNNGYVSSASDISFAAGFQTNANMSLKTFCEYVKHKQIYNT